MARQVLPIVGAVVGAYFGSPQLGYAIGAIIGNAVDPQVIQGPKLGDASVQTAAEGVFRPVVHGTAAVKGNIIHRGNRRIITVEEQQGKGGPVTETQRELWTFAIRICEGPIAGVTRIWADEKLVYDNRPGGDIPEDSLEWKRKFQLYLGDETQLPDPKLEAWLGVGNVSAYRGTAYCVFHDFDLTDLGGRVPDLRFEVSESVSTVILEKVPRVPFTPETNHVGALLPGQLSDLFVSFTNMNNSSVPDVVDGELLWHPMMLAEVNNFSPSDGGVVRAQIIGNSDQVIFDSLWVGRKSLQGDLDDLLNTLGRSDMIADLSGTTQVLQEVRPEPGVRVKGVRLFRARPAGTSVETNAYIGIQFPALSYYPEGTIAGSLPGVMVRPDGSLLAASWGPDNAYQSGALTNLAHVVGWCHLRAGHSAADYNVSQLDIEMNGIVFSGDFTCADAIRTLQPVYMFDYTECDSGSGYRCNYIKRGGSVLRTLAESDLVDLPAESKREDALERPRVLHMHFESPSVGYAPAKASPRRSSPDVRVVGEQSIQVPVSFRNVDEAWKRADVMLKVLWTEIAGEREFVLSDADLDLVPTDVIGMAVRGRVERLRITEVILDGGMLRVKAVSDRQSAYTSTLTGVPLPKPTPPPPSIAGQTLWEFMDIPALNDFMDHLHYYVAATGASPGWSGAEVQRLEGDNYRGVRQIAAPDVMGELLDPISGASPHYTDTTNRVRIRLYREGVLPSLSQQQFLSEGGAFALDYLDGTWELMQYRDAEEVGDGVWELSTLLRGRMYTESAPHPAGGRFVLLSGVRSVDATSSFIDQTLTHRVVSYRTSPETAEAESDIYTARSQTEFPVAHVLLSRSGDSVNARIVPRHRFGTEDRPVRSQHWIGYEWSATDGANTASGATTSDTFAIDATGWASPVSITVAQVNRYTGAGPYVSESIE